VNSVLKTFSVDSNFSGAGMKELPARPDGEEEEDPQGE